MTNDKIQMNHKNPNNKKGVTFPEVLVAIVIVAFVLIGLLDMFGRGHLLVELNKRKTEALFLIQRRVEGIKADPNYDGLVGLYNDRTESATLSGGIPAAIKHSLIENQYGTRIYVEITWNDILDNGQVKEYLVVMRADHE